MDGFITAIQNSIPILIATGKIDPFYGVFLFPLFLIAYKYLRELTASYFERRTGGEVCLVVSPFSCFEHISNNIYEDLFWYIENNLKINRAVFFQNGIRTVGPLYISKPVQQKIMPVYTLIDCDKITLDYEGKTIAVKLKKNEKNSDSTDKNLKPCRNDKPNLELYAENWDTLKQFVAFVSKEFSKFKEELSFELSSHSFHNGWTSLPVNVEKSKNNLFLSDDVCSAIFDRIKSFNEEKEWYAKMGMVHKLGFLFSGTPGCGKSSTVYAIARQFEMNIYKLNAESVSTRDSLLAAISSVPPKSIVLFEDIDCVSIMHQRKEPKSDELSVMKQTTHDTVTLSDILDILDGNEFLRDSIVIFTSNFPEMLDSALIREGRIDRQIEFLAADFQMIKKIFQFFYEDFDFDNDDTFNSLSKNIRVPQSKVIYGCIMPNRHDPVKAMNQLLLMSK
jgi:hypothetical protein